MRSRASGNIYANWLSNRVFENYDAIIEAFREASNKLIEIPNTNKSIGMRERAHVDRSAVGNSLKLFKFGS